MDEKESVSEEEKETSLNGIITMMLSFNRKIIQRLIIVLIVSILVNIGTVGGFLWYLSHFDVEVSSFGTIEGSNKINTSTGILEQQAQSITNNNGTSK